MGDDVRVPVDRDADIVAARQKGREIALEVGLTGSDLTLVATAISEVARNIISYAAHGEIVLRAVQKEGRRGISVIARDQGPGIADIGQAMQDGFSTGNSLGLGLPGARRLMDEFEIHSVVGEGTTVAMWKWAR
ncbi:MAG TPA: anti-sigma regulatory factor [Caulobacter sp.]|nr:anti-sigma regulatory factor [Caulobacter sp.]